MKKRLLSLVLAVMLVFSLLPASVFAAETAVEVTVAGTEHYGYAAEVFDLVNTSRAENSLSQLSRNATLTELAMQRAAEIALYYHSDHLRPDGSGASTIADGVYTGWTAYGENIAIGQLDPDEVMEDWMNSEGHRANILDSDFTQIGIGCFEADGVCCWVQIFGNSTSNTQTTSTTGSIVTTRDIHILPSNLNLSPAGTKSLELEQGESTTFSITTTNPGFSPASPTLIPKTQDVTSGGTTIATVSASDDGTITVTAQNPGAGSSQITVYDGQTSPLTLTVTVPDAEETEPPVTTEPTEPDPTETEPVEPEPTETEPTAPAPTDSDVQLYSIGLQIATEQNCTAELSTNMAQAGETVYLYVTIINDQYDRYTDEVTMYGHTSYDMTLLQAESTGDVLVYSFQMPAEDVSLEVWIYGHNGYSIDVYNSEGGTAAATATEAEAGDSFFLYVHPDEGYTVDQIYYYTADGTDLEYEWISETEIYIVMPASDLVFEVYFVLSESPFVDVKESNYFYQPVLWAVSNGITTGIGNNRFGPSNPCTRAQVVTFLWRACGSPDPQNWNNPFTDVKESAYYYKAVLWAVENGITSGISATRFGPNSPCTRAQVVTFLWRTASSPEPGSSSNPFVDVRSSSYYYKAVLWAVEYGITSGVDATHFGPNNTCTRGQIVTFLYRAFHG